MMKSVASTLASLALVACASDPSSPAVDTTPDAGSDEQGSGSAMEPTPDAMPQPTGPMAGDLDPTFGTGGILPLHDAVGDGLYAASLARQGNQMIACMTAVTPNGLEGRIARFNTDGSLDKTFGTDGVRRLGADGSHTACIGAAAADGVVAAVYRNLDQNKIYMVRHTVDGTTMDQYSYEYGPPGTGTGTASGNLAIGMNYQGLFGVRVSNPSVTFDFHPAETAFMGKVVRGLQHDNTYAVVGMFDLTGIGYTTWNVHVGTGTNFLSQLGGTIKIAPNGGDIMNDAVFMPDGSVFAVGSVGTGTEVLVARFSSANTLSEHHSHGGPSMGRAVVLDSANRPVVLGGASKSDGTSVFGWQRYEADGLALDSSYRDGGLASVEAPSGQGELVDAVRIGDGIYAIGQYDVQSATPKLALVKIVD